MLLRLGVQSLIWVELREVSAWRALDAMHQISVLLSLQDSVLDASAAVHEMTARRVM